ncbi:DNA repair protein complementing XP-C cells homolog [Toxorhynchites rutilus septentrionalis]|uniref:DNA repair protein complementing XP-C cells homolog n=1 Tax=Toxorhynchites rutilus septentrionalis TaxID=329112 RepID=UPI0024796A31|nr:DNA repair protein complementing XP-C cells homolog [Toxorhynchites rutilus septentrionalis]XP_055634447.1 DNA repair protein complementing XP-C cells homolog [Toxorhynchites rutilus septentrionalis]
MSEITMSDDEEQETDFQASEDEWLPEKSDGRRLQVDRSGTESDEISGEENKRPAWKKREHGGAKGRSSRTTATRKTRGSIKPTVSFNAQRKKMVVETNDNSESSGDEHLVNPNMLDLNSDFFMEPANDAASKAVPTFDCNAGTHLSDSSGDEHEGKQTATEKDKIDARESKRKLIAKINQKSQGLVNFESLNEFNRKIEQAKQQLLISKTKKSDGSGSSSISNILAMGEHKGSDTQSTKTGEKKKDESDSDWEDVEEKEENGSHKDVEITLDMRPVVSQKKKRDGIDVEACIRRIENRRKRENQIVLHKVNILMAISHGNYVNNTLNSTKLLSLALTLVPSKKCYPKNRTNLEYFEQVTKFYREIIDLKDKRMFNRFKKLSSLETSLRLEMLTKATTCKRDHILIFIILLRAIGIQCRLVMSLVVAPKKLPQSELNPSQMESTRKVDAKGSETSKSSTNQSRQAIVIPQLDGNDDSCGEPFKKRILDNTKKQSSKKNNLDAKPESNTKSALSPKTAPKLLEICKFSPRKTRKQRQAQAEPSSSTGATDSKKQKISNNTDAPSSSSSISIVYTKKEPSDPARDKNKRKQSSKCANTDTVPALSLQPTQLPKKSDAGDKQSRKSTVETSNPTRAIKTEKSGKSKTPPETKPPKILKIEYIDKKLKRRLDRRVLSTDDECMAQSGDKPKLKSGVNLWVEVYAEEEEQWIPVDVIGAKVHCAEQIARQASSPLVYILAWNNDGTIKDVTARYCKNYATSTKKLRIEQEWLDETLRKYKGKQSARDIEEDRSLNQTQLEQPLPTAIGEYKNHPLYALKRHLLKFEGIYPPDAPTLGFIKDEPVYARECVHTLHSREIWLKQARTVKMFESPYKVVNARPKFDRASGQMQAAQPLDLFGYWQTQDYEPPTAENGIVPRNAYGNVELFKPCMLPKKTVHLQLPGLNRICKKLGIDCAQAVTGFDFHGGSSHPVYDGSVVCEEYKDIVVDAWYQEQEEGDKREQEKYEKRVYGNWKKLIKGLLIRKKLQNKYNFDNL